MILKIYTGSGWRYIDGVKEVNVEQTSPEIYKKQYGEHGRSYDANFIQYHEFTDEGRTLRTSIANTMFPVKEVWIRVKDEITQSYIVDTECYLMSDSGQTIERIN